MKEKVVTVRRLTGRLLPIQYPPPVGTVRSDCYEGSILTDVLSPSFDSQRLQSARDIRFVSHRYSNPQATPWTCKQANYLGLLLRAVRDVVYNLSPRKTPASWLS